MTQKQTLSMIHRFEPGENLRQVIERGKDVFIVTDRGLYLLETIRIFGETPLAPVTPEPPVEAAPTPARKTREPKAEAAPKRSPRMQAACDDAYKRIQQAAATPTDHVMAPNPIGEARDRDAALRRARRQGWKEVKPGRRPPARSERGMVHGVEMWRKR